MAKQEFAPFPISMEDVEGEESPKRRKVKPKPRRPRYQALNEDLIWIAEQEIARLKRTMEERTGPLTDKENNRFLKTAETLRKLRWTDAELHKMHDPSNMEDGLIDEEFEERCKALDLDPKKVLKAFGLE